MKTTVASWTLIGIAALVAGPIAGRLVGGVPAPDGGPDATMLVNDALSAGISRTFAAMIIAGAMGLLTARVSSVRAGLLAAGAVLVWPAWTSARVEGLLQSAQSGDPFVPLAVEGLVLGGIAVAICIAMALVQPASPDHESDGARGGVHFRKDAMIGLVTAIVVGGVAAWLIAREGLKGQTLAAGAIASIAACTVGRIVAGGAPVAVFVAGLGVLAVASPALGATIDGSDALARSFSNDLFPLARIAPLDWIAGAFLGAPIGLAWGASMLEKKAHEA